MIGLDNPIHLVLLLVIILLIFGAKRLPDMGRSLGSGLRGFKEAVSGETSATTDGGVLHEPTHQLTAAAELPRADPQSAPAAVAETVKTRSAA